MNNELSIAKTDLQRLLSEEYVFLKDTIDAISVKTEADMANAGDFRKKVNTLLKRIEDRRKELVDPFNKLVKDINGEYKKVSEIFGGLLTELDNKIKPFLIEQARAKEQAAEALRQKALKEMEERKVELAKMAVETEKEVFVDMTAAVAEEQAKLAGAELYVKKSVQGDDSSTAVVDNWKYRVVSEKDVDRLFMSPDDKKLKFFLKEHLEGIKKGEVKLAGIEFYNDPYVKSR